MDNQTHAFRLGQWLHEISEGLGNRVRWKRFHEPYHREQSVIHHVLEALMLTSIVVEIEKSMGKNQFDAYKLMRMVLLHDLPEVHLDDLIYEVKNVGNIAAKYKELETEVAKAMVDKLPAEARSAFTESFQEINHGGSSIESELFDAIERLGYILDAFEPLRLGRNSYLVVFTHHWSKLEEYSKKYPGIQIIFDGYKELFGSQLPAQLALPLGPLNLSPAPGNTSPSQ